MFIPLYDSNHLRHIRLQYVTLSLIAINVIVYLRTTVGGEDFATAAVLGLGYIPSVVHDLAELSPDLIIIPEDLSYITYSFLHGDIFHRGGNMLFLWVFGDNVGDALGHFRFLVFYLLCAVAGAFLHGLILPDSQTPLIGASGAIAGIVAAYLILYPRVKVWVLAFARIPLRIPAWIPLILWVAFQVLMIAIGGDDEAAGRRMSAASSPVPFWCSSCAGATCRFLPMPKRLCLAPKRPKHLPCRSPRARAADRTNNHVLGPTIEAVGPVVSNDLSLKQILTLTLAATTVPPLAAALPPPKARDQVCFSAQYVGNRQLRGPKLCYSAHNIAVQRGTSP